MMASIAQDLRFALRSLRKQPGVTAIALANLWNRLNVTTRQVTGDWVAQYL